MSQTFDSAEETETESARRSFDDLQSMMMQGRSFSGRERNCCFLNTGQTQEAGGRFANVSAASGLDFADDGRAVAIVDWDMDGDLDLWISNRNAPRLRLMRNDTPTLNRFLALRLEGDGTTTNRDAIGARVEVVLADRDAQPRIKTLHAGEGFIAQSSKWLHFGLGRAESVEKVIVRWPSREGSPQNVEEFSGFAVDRRYRLVQGRGEPVEVTVRRPQIALKPSVQQVPSRSDAVRVRLVTLLPMPSMRFSGGPGGTPLSTGAGKPVLLTLWASWCLPCRAELAEFTDRAAEIRSAGIEVVALSVDKPSDLAAASAMLREMRFPFTSGPAAEELVMLLQWYHDEVTQQEGAMPIPISFLITADGRLAALYKGGVGIDDLVADVGHATGTRAERWVRSAPLPGRSIEHPQIERIANAYDMTVHLRMASSLIAQGRLEGAMACYREVLGISADEVTALNNLAWLLATHPSDRVRNGHEASQLATRLVESSDEQPNAGYLDTLAAAQAEAGRFSEAVSSARQALSMARSDNDENLARTIAARLALYERGRPYHEPSR